MTKEIGKKGVVEIKRKVIYKETHDSMIKEILRKHKIEFYETDYRNTLILYTPKKYKLFGIIPVTGSDRAGRLYQHTDEVLINVKNQKSWKAIQKFAEELVEALESREVIVVKDYVEKEKK